MLNKRLEHGIASPSAFPGPLNDFPQLGGTQNQNSQHASIFECHSASDTQKEHNFGCDDSPKMLNMPLEHKIAQEYSDFMAASIAGYEKVNKSPGTSLSQESHAGPLEGQTPVGVNGEGRHGLIIPLS